MILPPIDSMMGWFFKLIIAGVISFLWWCKKEDTKLLTSHTKDLVQLKATTVTEDKVREIIVEVTSAAICPMAETLKEIKHLVTDNSEVTKRIQIKMAEQEGYQKAVNELANRPAI